MVKDFGYIIKRVIIGVLIALILMALKGGLIADVYALNDFTLDLADRNECRAPSNCQYTNGVTGEYWYPNQDSGPVSIIYNIGNVTEGYYDISFIITSQKQSFDYQASSTSALNTFYTDNTIRYIRIIYDGVTYFGSYSPLGTGVYKANISNVPIKPNTTIQMVVNFESPIRYDISSINSVSCKLSFYYSPIANGNSEIVNAIDEGNQKQNETNDLIKDDTIDNDNVDSSLDDLDSSVSSNGTITQLISLPITLYQAVLNSASGSCSPFSLGNLYDHEIVLPCINLESLLGSTLYSIIDILCCGLFILAFRKKMVDIFNHMTSLNDRGNEVE